MGSVGTKADDCPSKRERIVSESFCFSLACCLTLVFALLGVEGISDAEHQFPRILVAVFVGHDISCLNRPFLVTSVEDVVGRKIDLQTLILEVTAD